MKMYFLIFSLLAFPLWNAAQPGNKGFQITSKDSEKQVDVLYNGKLVTAYCYTDSISKPFLYPVNTLSGITITRSFPVRHKEGERTDHPHHVGMWMNYESVNGIDFWNNSSAIPKERKPLYGTIRHDQIISKSAKENTAQLKTTAKWFNSKGTQYLNEETTYDFKVENDLLLITRSTLLAALDSPVIFKDAKDGFFAIRVARELELPDPKFTQGPAATGMYYAANGKTGDAVWSSQANWAVLKGKKEGQPITIGMFDHPGNPGYPTYWHARGYGLFALNPLGRAVFSNGKENFNFTLKPHQKQLFVYRVAIAAKDLNEKTINEIARAFAKTRY